MKCFIFSNRNVWNATLLAFLVHDVMKHFIVPYFFKPQSLKCNVTCFSSTWRYKTFHFPVLFQTATFEIQRLKIKLNSEKIWKIQKKSKLSSEKIWKLSKKKVSWIVKRYVFSKSFHYLTYFSSIISISFHYSTYFSSVFSISFHYSAYFSSIISMSFH
jgi:hypothetical protein